MNTNLLTHYPCLCTQQELVSACKMAHSIFLCGQASEKEKWAVAKAIAAGNPTQKVLYITCSSSVQVSEDHLRTSVNSEDLPQIQATSTQNLFITKLYDNFAEKFSRILQTYAFAYRYFMITGIDVPSDRRMLLLSVPVDTLVLLPGHLNDRQIQELLIQIYDYDYTITGVIEPDVISAL